MCRCSLLKRLILSSFFVTEGCQIINFINGGYSLNKYRRQVLNKRERKKKTRNQISAPVKFAWHSVICSIRKPPRLIYYFFFFVVETFYSHQSVQKPLSRILYSHGNIKKYYSCYPCMRLLFILFAIPNQ